MTYVPAKVTTSNGLGGDALQENMLFDCDPTVKGTQKIVQYPLHHVTYALAKFEIARANGLRGDAFAKKYII